MEVEEIRKLIDELLTLPTVFRKMSRRSIRLPHPGITHTQMMVMAVLWHCAPVNMSLLCEEVVVSNQQMTRLVDTLAQKNLVERVADPANRRTVLVSMTAEGKRFWESYRDAVIDTLCEMLSHFPRPEIDAMLQALIGLRDIIVKMSEHEMLISSGAVEG